MKFISPPQSQGLLNHLTARLFTLTAHLVKCLDQVLIQADRKLNLLAHGFPPNDNTNCMKKYTTSG
jgi:hypothetical protein